MSTLLTPHSIGRNVTITVTPQDVTAGTGALSDNAVGALVFKGRWKRIGEDSTFNTENISAADNPYSNPVITEQGITYQIDEILDKVLAKGSKLEVAIDTSFYAKVVMTVYDRNYDISSPSAKRVYTVYGIFTGIRTEFVKGEHTVSATIQSIAINTGTDGVYTANPTIA